MRKYGMKILFSLLGGIVFFTFFSNVSAQFVVPDYDEYVTDIAGVLTDEQESDMEAQIYDVWKATDVEMAVLFVNSLSGESVRYAGVQVGDERKVGDKEKDNGVIILIAVGDRQWTIQVGYGLEGVLTDAISKRIGEADFPPYFREGNYASGVSLAIEEMYKYILEDPEIMALYDDPTGSAGYNYRMGLFRDHSMWAGIMGFVYFFLGCVLVNKYVINFHSKKKDKKGKDGKKKQLTKKEKKKFTKKKVNKEGRANFGIIGVLFTAVLAVMIGSAINSAIESFVILFVALGIMTSDGSGGSGSYNYHSSSHSYSSSSYSSSSSSSSFGGFGGGSFGGGGASGGR